MGTDMPYKGVWDDNAALIGRRRDASGPAPMDVSNQKEEEAATNYSPGFQYYAGAAQGLWDAQPSCWVHPADCRREEEVHTEVCQS